MRIVQNSLPLLLVSALAVAFLGCQPSTGPDNGDAGGVPPGKSIVDLSIQGTRPAAGSVTKARSQWGVTQSDSVVLPVKDVNGLQIGTLTLTDARVALKDIELESEDENEGEDLELDFPGPFVVDLIHNTVIPAQDTVIVDSGRYTQIEIKLDKIEGDEDDEGGIQLVDPSDPLFGNSIYLEGTYTGATDSGSVTSVPFILSFDFNETFELSGVGDSAVGFIAEEGVVNPIIIAFRLARWFSFSDTETNPDGVDFNLLTVLQDTSGQPIIILDEKAGDTSDANKEIREVIEENIEESADYGKDKDGDGELGSDEDDDPDEEDDDDD